MGNVYEKWMDDTLDSFENKDVTIPNLTNKIIVKRESKIGYYLKNILFTRFFKKRKYKRVFYRFKGMPKEMIKTY
jgi:hypothetical protein